MAKTPYQKILRAASRGTGLRLTSEEVAKLAGDSAIETVAGNDDENEVERRNEERADRRARKGERDAR
jgi:hypothetical protein